VPARDQQERSLQARAASNASWAHTANRAARLANAHAGRDAYIARHYGIPADLPPAEYELRMGSARKAYFASLALKSVKARRRNVEARRAVQQDGAAA
jgi:hypothetical protein